MLAGVEDALGIELVLLPMFQAIEESIAVGSFKGDPRCGGWTDPCNQIEISVVAGDGEERVEGGTKSVGSGEVEGMIALADVEGAAVDLDGFQNLWNENVGSE